MRLLTPGMYFAKYCSFSLTLYSLAVPSTRRLPPSSKTWPYWLPLLREIESKVPHIQRVGEMQARCRHGPGPAVVSRVLLILGLLLVLAPSAGGANQHERRTATLLYGVPSDGFQSCFAPFLHRQVEYQLNANAAWGFGNHATKHSTANVSAIVRVSTQLGSAGSKETVFWVHTLEVVRMWSTKSYADNGSPQTQTQSNPRESPRFRVRIVQRECSKFSDIIHSPHVSAEELKFAHGLAPMILFSLPSADDVESEIHQEGPHGPRPALFSIHRVRNPNALKSDDRQKRGQTHMYVTHVKSLVNETKAPIRLSDGTAVPLRDEIS